MPEAPRNYEAELRAIMDALAESVAEVSDEDVLQEAREEGEDPRAIADRVRSFLKRAANSGGGRILRAAHVQSPNRLALEAESDILPALELAFATKSLRQLCESEAEANRHLGVRVSEKLRRRLSDLRAATSVKDLVASRPRELRGVRQPYLAVELCEGSRLVFGPNHTVMPVLESGDVDWSRVSRVRILRIERDDG
jgi:proteic killer suppression protein